MKLLCITAIFFMIACQAPDSVPAKKTDTTKVLAAIPAKPDSTTLGGGWYLQPVLPSDTATGKTAQLQLDLAKSRFTGNTGCNPMHGEFWYSKNDSSLSFSDKIITTKMACPGYNEGAFIKSLQHATHFRLRDGVLSLMADDNSELSRWVRKPSAPAKALKA
jgi:heat shock protein HslJ